MRHSPSLLRARAHLKSIQRQVNNKLSGAATIILFDHFGVVCSDPLKKWKLDHQLPDRQAVQVATLCSKVDAGQLELQPFYAELGTLTRQTGHQVRHELEANGEYNLPLLELIRHLRASGNIRIGLLSNAHRSLHTGLWIDGIHPLFDDVLTSQEVSKVRPKPDPEFFYHAINRLGGVPERTIFFDDRQVNVDGAKEAGLKAHLFTTAAQCKVDLHKHKIFD